MVISFRAGTRNPNPKKLQEAVWSLCSCPQCGERLAEEDVFPKLSQSDREGLDELIARKARESHPQWVWCLSPSCSSGQIYQPRKKLPAAEVICVACGHRSCCCFYHRLPWHEGSSCAEFDSSHPLGTRGKTSEEVVKSISKACPGCKRRVQKDWGVGVRQYEV